MSLFGLQLPGQYLWSRPLGKGVMQRCVFCTGALGVGTDN